MEAITRVEAIATRVEAMATRVEAVATRVEAIATRVETIPTRLEAITTRVEAIATRLVSNFHELLGSPYPKLLRSSAKGLKSCKKYHGLDRKRTKCRPGLNPHAPPHRRKRAPKLREAL